MNKKRLIIEEKIKEKNADQKQKVGCLKSVINFIFYFFLAIIIIMCILIFIFKETIPLILIECVVFIILIKLLANFIEKKLSNVFNKNIHKGKVKINIKKCSVTNRRDELEYSYVPNTEREKAVFYLDFSNDNGNFTLRVGYDIWTKLKIGDEVYVIKINDKYYGDMIFSTQEYFLDDNYINSLENDIYINI